MIKLKGEPPVSFDLQGAAFNNGSGFVIGNTIVTAAHVLDNPIEEIWIDGVKLSENEVVRTWRYSTELNRLFHKVDAPPIEDVGVIKLKNPIQSDFVLPSESDLKHIEEQRQIASWTRTAHEYLGIYKYDPFWFGYGADKKASPYTSAYSIFGDRILTSGSAKKLLDKEKYFYSYDQSNILRPGDSGGPLAFVVEGRFVVIGIATAGRIFTTSVFEKIDHNLPWIKHMVGCK